MNTHNSCLILLLTVLLVTVSCAEKSGSKYQDATLIEYQDFVSSQKLTGINFLSDKEVLKPMRIYVCDTILITMNPMEKKLFHLFSLKSKKEIGKRISLGQGPDEMIRPSIIKFNENQILIFDVATFTLFTYDTEDFISNENTIPLERKTIELQAYGEIGLLSDNLIGSTYNPKNQFIKFDNNGKKVGEFGYYPVVADLSYTDDEKLEAFKSSFVTNMKDRIAVCYKWTDLI
ncbi:MAG: BF3164 family lipoprotein, partial [Bacteroides sp.]|nr:BF3164 family lipoprotein [Bacteroides sp.]